MPNQPVKIPLPPTTSSTRLKWLIVVRESAMGSAPGSFSRPVGEGGRISIRSKTSRY